MRSAPNAPCGFRWTTQQLPDDAQAAQEALTAASIAVREVTASGFGEECVTSRGTVKGFGVLAETVNLTVEAADLADQAALGDLLGWISHTIDNIPLLARNTTLQVTFQSPAASASCEIDLRASAQAYRNSARGAPFFAQFWTCPLP